MSIQQPTKSIIVAIVGMSGAGKSEASSFFKEQGFPVLRFGSVIDEGIQEAGLPWTAESNALYRRQIREELGMAAVAIKMQPKIDEMLKTNTTVILDGLYSWEEFEFLKNKLPSLTLLCIYARPEIRYERLAKRQDRPFTPDQARERDIHEITVINKGGPIAFADYLISNETTKEALHKQLEEFSRWMHL